VVPPVFQCAKIANLRDIKLTTEILHKLIIVGGYVLYPSDAERLLLHYPDRIENRKSKKKSLPPKEQALEYIWM